MKQINLRDYILEVTRLIDMAVNQEELEYAAELGLEYLREVQDALIKLEDGDWNKLGLDFEFIL